MERIILALTSARLSLDGHFEDQQRVFFFCPFLVQDNGLDDLDVLQAFNAIRTVINSANLMKLVHLYSTGSLQCFFFFTLYKRQMRSRFFVAPS